MKRSIFETILGAVVIAVALVFLVFGLKTANVSTAAQGYMVLADFSGIGGLKPGDAVQVSGVKVGTVTKVELDPQSYLARVTMMLRKDVQLPADTTAAISNESLLGGRYLALTPGGEEEIIAPGGKVKYTQAPQNLEELLGKFIFSVQDEKKEEAESTPSAAVESVEQP
ncbi:MAG: outer membrane lipid asymmetry maintenance protein MlaD [Alphaproteobacteria bacterium]|nr:outer membrane lipid asymmetry maintenance protein MlaD [Alphaproteobacteria bacterium]